MALPKSILQAKPLLVIAIFTLLLFYSFQQGYSQHKEPSPVFKHFSVDDGIPSNATYHVIQDSIGYIWVATDNGVSRYDGYTFKNYGIEEGLVESTIHEIFIDYKNRYWFISNSGRLAYMEDEIIKPYKYNFRINEYVAKSRGTVKKSFYIDSLDNVYLSLKGFGRLTISKEGIVKETLSSEFNASVLLEELDCGATLVSYSSFSNPNNITVKGPNRLYNLQSKQINSIKGSPFHTYYIKHNEWHYTLSTKGHLFSIENGEVTDSTQIGTEIIWASADANNSVWAAPIEGGVVMLKRNNEGNELKRTFLKNRIITSVTPDSEGGYWFSTLTNGVYYSPNINALVYTNEQGLPSSQITSVRVAKQGIYCGDELGKVTRISKRKLEVYNIESPYKGNSPIRFISIDTTENTVWVGSISHLHSIKKGKVQKHTIKNNPTGTYPRQLIKANDNEYWLASSWGIRKFNGTYFTYNSREENEFSGMVYTVYQDSSGTVWIGSTNGIWQYNNGTYEYLGDNNPLFAQAASHIKSMGKKLLIATKGIGLIVLENDNAKTITQNNGLSSNYINKIVIDSSTAWLATKRGICAVTFNNDSISIKNITTSNGLPTNEVNDLSIYNNTLYAATPKGLCVIEKSLVSDRGTAPPKAIITGITVNGKLKQNLNTNSPLSYNENSITFNFVGFSYQNRGSINYQFRLLNIDSTWIETKATSSSYPGLHHGSYTFQVRMQGIDNTWGSPEEVSFTILPPFWQRFWFITLLAIFFSAIIFFIFKYRIAAIKKRNELKNNLYIYKQQSLRQQMNPHFIFNTLNSIQLYILEKDHISSHKYLTKFAKLMRLILDNSQQPTIALKDELDALKLYLELESIRLSGKFDYTINIENDELLQYKVPTLLIQPFVENSIWHGIMLKASQEGWVTITIKKALTQIVCTIEDNGIGREKAQEIRSKQDNERKSLGFKITSQRIELLNTLYKNKFFIKYIDVTADNGEPSGTRVEITIPIDLE